MSSRTRRQQSLAPIEPQARKTGASGDWAEAKRTRSRISSVAVAAEIREARRQVDAVIPHHQVLDAVEIAAMDPVVDAGIAAGAEPVDEDDDRLGAAVDLADRVIADGPRPSFTDRSAVDRIGVERDIVRLDPLAAHRVARVEVARPVVFDLEIGAVILLVEDARDRRRGRPCRAPAGTARPRPAPRSPRRTANSERARASFAAVPPVQRRQAGSFRGRRRRNSPDRATLRRRALTAGHSVSSMANHAVSRLRPLMIICCRKMPSKVKPSRSAARRDGAMSALHFHFVAAVAERLRRRAGPSDTWASVGDPASAAARGA